MGSILLTMTKSGGVDDKHLTYTSPPQHQRSNIKKMGLLKRTNNYLSKFYFKIQNLCNFNFCPIPLSLPPNEMQYQ